MKPVEKMSATEIIKHVRRLKACKVPDAAICEACIIKQKTLKRILYGQNYMIDSGTLASKLFGSADIHE